MSEKEKSGTSGMRPPPTSMMQPRPPPVNSRAPWSMSHVLRGQPMMNMPPPFYHMLHVPNRLAIVNTRPMFLQHPPIIQHHSSEGVACSCIPGSKALATAAACHPRKDSPETMTTASSCSASGTLVYDDALLKFQKNAELHGIKTSQTTVKQERSGSCAVGCLNAASPEFTPHRVIPVSSKTTLSEIHLPGEIVVLSDDSDDEYDLKGEDTTNCSKDDENQGQEITGVPPLVVNGADNDAIAIACLYSDSEEVDGQLSQFASGMPLNSDGGVCVVGCAMCKKHREMVSTDTQTEMTMLENVKPQKFDKCSSTEDLKVHRDQGTSMELTTTVASARQNDDPMWVRSKNEKWDVSAKKYLCCSAKVSSLNTIDDSTSEEEVDLPTERKPPAVTEKPKTSSLTSDTFLLSVKQEHPGNSEHQVGDARGQPERPNLKERAKTSSLTSNMSSVFDQEERSDSLVHDLNGVRDGLERWEKTEERKTNSVTRNTSSTVIKRELRDCIDPQPSDFRDELRRRNIAAIEAVSKMYETEQVVGKAERATDSVTKVANHLNTLTELNIKHPEVDQLHRPEDNSNRLEAMPGSVIYEDQLSGASASSARQMSKLLGSEERNNLSDVLSRSGRSSVNNCSMLDNISRQQKGPSSNHSGASAKQHTNCHADSRNVGLEEAGSHIAGASRQDSVCSYKTASFKGIDGVTRSESEALKKASNTSVENVDVAGSSNRLLDGRCSPNVMTSTDDESGSSSENVSVLGGERKFDCPSMVDYMRQIGLPVPSTEVVEMIKNQLIMYDPTLSDNPQVLEALAVQQYYLLHQGQMVVNQVMAAAMGQHQQPQLLLPQQLQAHPLLTPQQLLLQQHMISHQQLAQPQLLPPHQFMLPQVSKPQHTLPPRLARKLSSQGNFCAEIVPAVRSSLPGNSHFAACTDSSAFNLGTSVEDSELQKRSWQDGYPNQTHQQLKPVKSEDSAIKVMAYNPLSSATKSAVSIKDSSPSVSSGHGLLGAASPASRGRCASSVSSAAFRPNGAQSAVTSPAATARSACAQAPASSASLAGSGSGKLSELSDFKGTDLCGKRKSLFGFGGNDAEAMSAVPVSSTTKPSHSSVLASERIRSALSETAEFKASDNSFGARGRANSGQEGILPKAVMKVGNARDGASADGQMGRFRSQEQSQDSVNFNKGEYVKEKLPEFKKSIDGPATQGSAPDQFGAMGGDFVKHRKDFVPQKAVSHNRWMEGSFRSTSARFQDLEEDWGEAGSTNWIKDPVHYGPPKCSSSRVRPKHGDL